MLKVLIPALDKRGAKAAARHSAFIHAESCVCEGKVLEVVEETITVSGANRQDSMMFEATLDATPTVPRLNGKACKCPDKLHADRKRPKAESQLVDVSTTHWQIRTAIYCSSVTDRRSMIEDVKRDENGVRSRHKLEGLLVQLPGGLTTDQSGFL